MRDTDLHAVVEVEVLGQQLKCPVIALGVEFVQRDRWLMNNFLPLCIGELKSRGSSRLFVGHQLSETALIIGINELPYRLRGQLKDLRQLTDVSAFGRESNRHQSSIDVWFICVSDGIKHKENNITLSQNVTITIEEKGKKWLMVDAGKKQMYPIRVEGDQPNVFKSLFYSSRDPLELPLLE